MPRKNSSTSAERSFEANVLVTSAVDGVRDCGSGFCVRANGTDAFIVTCHHVVNDLDPK
jgi:hypothetical protein